MKRQKATFKYAFEGTEFQVQLRDGRVVARFDREGYNDDILLRITEYGHKQKIVDAASEGDTPAKRLELMTACHERLLAGEWEAERAGFPTVSPIIEALARIKEVPIAAMQKKWATLDDAAREKLQANAKVREMLQRVMEEREEAEEIDLDDLS